MYDLVISDLLSKEVSKPVGLLYSKAKKVNQKIIKIYFFRYFEKSKNYEPDVDYLSYLDKYSNILILNNFQIGILVMTIRSHRQKLALLELTFKFANELIEKYKFNLHGWSISGLLSYVLYTVFKFEGVKSCAIESGRFPDNLQSQIIKIFFGMVLSKRLVSLKRTGLKAGRLKKRRILEQYRTNLPVPTNTKNIFRELD